MKYDPSTYLGISHNGILPVETSINEDFRGPQDASRGSVGLDGGTKSRPALAAILATIALSMAVVLYFFISS